MNFQAQIYITVIPLAICVLAILPFIFFPSLREKDEEIRKPIYFSTFSYLICLGFIIIGLIILEAIEIMSSFNSTRSLFICAILFVACADKAIDLSPHMMFVKTNLIKRLLYFVAILCSIPIMWQILISLVPGNISENFKLMSTIQILLMLIILALGIVSLPSKKGKIQT